jgi:hypothetical protein
LRKIRQESAWYKPAVLDLSQTGDFKVIGTRFGGKANELSCPIAAVPFFSNGSKYFMVANLLYDKPLQIFTKDGYFVRVLGGKELGETSTLFSAGQQVYVANDYTGAICKFDLSDIDNEKLEWTAHFSPVESPEEPFVFRKIDFMTVSADLLYVCNTDFARTAIYQKDTGAYVSAFAGRSEKYAEHKMDDLRSCSFLSALPEPLSGLTALTRPAQSFSVLGPSNEFALVNDLGMLASKIVLNKDLGQLHGAAVDRVNNRLLLAVDQHIYVYTTLGFQGCFLAPGCESNILNLSWQTEDGVLLIFYGGAATNQVAAFLSDKAVNKLLEFSAEMPVAEDQR